MNRARPLGPRVPRWFKARPALAGPMSRAEDVSGALRAVWEVRRAEERFAYCLGAWNNIVFGAMATAMFTAYAGAVVLDAPQVVFAWLWLPILLAAYTALAFKTRSVLRLPRPTLPWGEVALGTGLFVALMGVLALAVANGVLRDVAAGMSMVIGVFYVVLGLVFIRERAPALFGLAVAAGAVAVALLDLPFPASSLYGVAVGAGMAAMGAWMLRHPGRGQHGAPAEPGDAGPGAAPELAEVRETLRQLHGHDARVRAREAAAKVLLASAVLALAGVAAMLSGAAAMALPVFVLAGLVAAWGVLRQQGAAHAP